MGQRGKKYKSKKYVSKLLIEVWLISLFLLAEQRLLCSLIPEQLLLREAVGNPWSLVIHVFHGTLVRSGMLMCSVKTTQSKTKKYF